MSLTYDQLRASIGFKAGYAPTLSTSTFVGNQAALVEEIMRRGLRRWADPPMLPGEHFKHQWSCLTPTLTLDLPSGATAIDLPANFVEFRSPLAYAPGASTLFPPLEIVGAEFVMKYASQATGSGRPRWGGVRVKDSQDVHVTAWELAIWPTADQDYQVKALTKIDPVIPGADDDIVIGGSAHEATILEACLCEAVAMLDDLDNNVDHESRFLSFLQASITHDRQVTAPQRLPRMVDSGLFDWRQWTVDAWCCDPQMEYVGASAHLV